MSTASRAFVQWIAGPIVGMAFASGVWAATVKADVDELQEDVSEIKALRETLGDVRISLERLNGEINALRVEIKGSK